MTFSEAIQKLLQHKSLTRPEAREAIGELMAGRTTPVQIAAFLTALRMKGETVDEITGAAEAMREAAIAVHSDAEILIDTCGTGGDGQGSFNVSTAAAFVVAGAGFAVAKHGNRSISSHCGSADILEALGIPIESDPKVAEASLKEAGIAFLFAPAFHPAMKHAMPVRRELGVRTIFNLLGPLTNPARPNVQLIGVYDPAWVKPVAQVLVQLGCREGLVVHGHGHDEIVLSGPTQVAEIEKGRVRLRTWRPKDFGLKSRPAQDLKGGSAERNAQILREILGGQHSAYREVVCMNAAAVIRAAHRLRRDSRKAMTLKEAYALAEQSIDTKRALDKLERLKETLAAAGARRG